SLQRPRLARGLSQRALDPVPDDRTRRGWAGRGSVRLDLAARDLAALLGAPPGVVLDGREEDLPRHPEPDARGRDLPEARKRVLTHRVRRFPAGRPRGRHSQSAQLTSTFTIPSSTRTGKVSTGS